MITGVGLASLILFGFFAIGIKLPCRPFRAYRHPGQWHRVVSSLDTPSSRFSPVVFGDNIIARSLQPDTYAANRGSVVINDQ